MSRYLREDPEGREFYSIERVDEVDLIDEGDTLYVEADLVEDSDRSDWNRQTLIDQYETTVVDVSKESTWRGVDNAIVELENGDEIHIGRSPRRLVRDYAHWMVENNRQSLRLCCYKE